MTTDISAFYEPDGTGGFLPRSEARSPWSPEMMHGRLLAGLAALRVEQNEMPDGFRPARLTIDLFRSPTMETVTTKHTVVREGRRIRVVQVDLAVGNQDVARANVVLMRTSAHPEGEVWNRETWRVPHPNTIASPTVSLTQSISSLDVRAIDGQGMGSAGQRRVWMRDLRPLVEGQATTPFARASMAADMASPLGNSGPSGLAFINADITVYLGRMPVGEWIGLEVGAHIGADGIAVSRSDLFDLEGGFGFTDVCAVATPRIGTS